MAPVLPDRVMSKGRMIVFDLDGTLYRTHETCLPAIREICARYHLILRPEDERVLLFTSNDTLLDRIAPGMPYDQRERFKRDIDLYEIGVVLRQGRLFEGIVDLLSTLSADGVALAICGMGSKNYIDAVLTRCAITRFFTSVYHGVDGRTKSQRLGELLEESGFGPHDSTFVGDSITDLTAARDNDVPFIGVSWGYGAQEISGSATMADTVVQLQDLLAPERWRSVTSAPTADH